jgi:hypothetical protein
MHPDSGSFEIQGFKKWKTHQVVPVGMRKKKIEIETPFIDQLIAQSANTGSRIDNNDITAFGPNVQAGRVATVL